MPTSTFLNTPYGGDATARFKMGGIDRLYLIPHNKIATKTEVKDGFGHTVEITAFTLVDGAKFVELGFVEDSASYTDTSSRPGTNQYMTETLTFSVAGTGKEAITAAHQILLTRRHAALVKRKDGKMYLLGNDFGLAVPADGNSANSGAKIEDDAAQVFTLTAGNLGYAPEVTLEASALAALVTELGAVVA